MTVLDASKVELETARKIFWLLRNDAIFLCDYNSDTDEHDEGVYPAINCNDLFVPGADAQKLDAEDLDKYIEVVKKYGDPGSAAWCAVKGRSRLWKIYSPAISWRDKYNEALLGVADLLGLEPPLELVIKPPPNVPLPPPSTPFKFTARIKTWFK